jgi:Ni/Co efflux regulator RcnB
MNHKAIVSAVMAIMISTGGSAFAQGKSDRDDRKGDRNDRSRGEQSQHYGQQDRRGAPDGRDNRGRGPQDKHYNERGAGPNHSYYRGQRLPAEYRNRQYVVNDWRSHRLSAPPRGYQWVQTGGDYVLVAIATGIILQLFLN